MHFAMQNAVRQLQIRHFRLIQTITDHGQLSVAAELLGMTQPAASRTLREIEATLGQPVFERHPKGMRPTPIGGVLTRHARSLIRDLGRAEEELRAYEAGAAGAVRVGAVTGAAVGYVVPAVQKLNCEDAKISVEVAPSTDLMEKLLSGELDFILSRVPTGTDISNLEILSGRVEVLSFLVRQGHPLQDRKSLAIEDLRDLTWVIQAPGMPIRSAIEHAFLSENVKLPAAIINSPSFLFITAHLLSSDSVTAVASEVADLLDASHEGKLQELDMQKTIVMSPSHLIRDTTRQIAPIAERLLDLVLTGMANHGPDARG